MSQSTAQHNLLDSEIPEGSDQGITRISVQGYKSLFAESSIEVGNLTIIAGANSSGKSSMMQPLLLMKQTLEAPFDPGALLLNGPNVEFTLMEQLLSTVSGQSANQFSIGLEVDGYLFIKNSYGKSNEDILEITETSIQDDEEEITFSLRTSQQEILERIPSLDEGDEVLISFLGEEIDLEEMKCQVRRKRCFLNLACGYEAKSTRGDSTKTRYFSRYSSGEQTYLLEMHILEMIHVPGLRNTPDRTYQITAIATNALNRFQFPGKFPNYVASVIDYWIRTHNERLTILERHLALLGLTNRIYTYRVSDTQIELRVDRLLADSTNNGTVSIADVGLGVSQVLPVLTALLVAEPGQLVYIEQPEIHLHPRAQVALAHVLTDAAKRGVRVVVETHSELLLLGIQTLVAEGLLPPNDVKLHWFRRQQDGITEITSATLDESGAFGDWPEDFGSISLDLQNRYLSAAEAHLWKSQNGK